MTGFAAGPGGERMPLFEDRQLHPIPMYLAFRPAGM
jgi:hypothetical protein